MRKTYNSCAMPERVIRLLDILGQYKIFQTFLDNKETVLATFLSLGGISMGLRETIISSLQLYGLIIGSLVATLTVIKISLDIWEKVKKIKQG